MNERRAQRLRFQGFALLMFALLQGFLIAAGVGNSVAQGRAHAEIFLVAFLIILIGLNATSLRLSQRAGTIVFFASLGSAYAGAIHTLLVATFGTASPMLEQIVPMFGILVALLFLPTIILTLHGLRRAPAR